MKKILNCNKYHNCVRLMVVAALIAAGMSTSYGYYEATINVATQEVEETSDIVLGSLGWTNYISIDMAEGDSIVSRLFESPGLTRYYAQKTYSSYEINVNFTVGNTPGCDDNRDDIAGKNCYDTFFNLIYDHDGLRGTLWILGIATQSLRQSLEYDTSTISMEDVLERPLLYYRDIASIIRLFMARGYPRDKVYDFLQEYEKRMSNAVITPAEDEAFRARILWYKYALLHTGKELGADDLKELGEIMHEINKTALYGDEK